jgi:hypothetical protein
MGWSELSSEKGAKKDKAFWMVSLASQSLFSGA